MVEGYGDSDSDPLDTKSKFILSLLEQIDDLGPQEKSLIDHCVEAVYNEAEQSGTVPTLSTLREKLLQQLEKEARNIALTMELFTTGSLDIFGGSFTVDLNKRRNALTLSLHFFIFRAGNRDSFRIACLGVIGTFLYYLYHESDEKYRKCVIF